MVSWTPLSPSISQNGGRWTRSNSFGKSWQGQEVKRPRDQQTLVQKAAETDQLLTGPFKYFLCFQGEKKNIQTEADKWEKIFFQFRVSWLEQLERCWVTWSHCQLLRFLLLLLLLLLHHHLVFWFPNVFFFTPFIFDDFFFSSTFDNLFEFVDYEWVNDWALFVVYLSRFAIIQKWSKMNHSVLDMLICDNEHDFCLWILIPSKFIKIELEGLDDWNLF